MGRFKHAARGPGKLSDLTLTDTRTMCMRERVIKPIAYAQTWVRPSRTRDTPARTYKICVYELSREIARARLRHKISSTRYARRVCVSRFSCWPHFTSACVRVARALKCVRCVCVCLWGRGRVTTFRVYQNAHGTRASPIMMRALRAVGLAGDHKSAGGAVLSLCAPPQNEWTAYQPMRAAVVWETHARVAWRRCGGHRCTREWRASRARAFFDKCNTQRACHETTVWQIAHTYTIYIMRPQESGFQICVCVCVCGLCTQFASSCLCGRLVSVRTHARGRPAQSVACRS